MNVQVNYKGHLIDDARIRGEQKRDGFVSHYSSCVRAARNRWFIVYDTRDTRGCDMSRSILYQVRSDAPDGPILTEGLLAGGHNDWDPLGTGQAYAKGHACPVVFGVPRGASRGGRTLPHANLFVARWFVMGGLETEDGKTVITPWDRTERWPEDVPHPPRGNIEWVQFSLNETEDDIELRTEITTPVLNERSPSGDRGEPSGACHPWHTYRAVPPENAEFAQWLDLSRCGQEVALMRYGFNHRTGLYEWTGVGRPVPMPGSEGGINKVGDDWVLTFRGKRKGATVWFRTPDPFAGFGPPTLAPDTYGPRNAFACADGVLRLFANNQNITPYEDRRNPLYCWDVDPREFSYANRQTVLDCRAEGLALRQPFIDDATLFPHHGRSQLISFRVLTNRQTWNTDEFLPVTAEELADSGNHYAQILYPEPIPDPWEWAR